MNMSKLQPWADLAARVALAALFIIAGFAKIGGYEGTAGYMQSMGVPGFLLPLVIALELVGGLAIAVGYRTRVVAFLLAGFSVLSGLIFHSPLDPNEQTQFLKNLAIGGGFLLLVVHGAGRYSLDARRG
jgi:putative oxidoreductase